MDRASQRDLRILTEIAQREDITQRALSKSVGIALGLTNLYLKRLARKGYIKMSTIPPNRLKYLLTPKGIAEKSRLTYEYMTLSLALYREAREQLRHALLPVRLDGLKQVGLYGIGEAGELAYLTLRELGVEPVAAYNDVAAPTFFGLPVRLRAALGEDPLDRVVVASFAALPATELAELRRLVPEDKLIFLNRPRP